MATALAPRQTAHSIVSDAVAEWMPDHSLPTALYADEAAYAADLDVIFGRHWICVGPELEVPNPGDYKLVELGRASIIIARQRDGTLQAYHNTCRHRGARIVDCSGKASRLICPYHKWSYRMDGSLLVAPSMGNAVDKANTSLKPVHIRPIGGLMFICLSDEASTDIEIMAADMEPRLAPYNLKHAKIAHEMDLIEHSNWKITIENNRECYHCPTTHPELNASTVADAYNDADNLKTVDNRFFYDAAAVQRRWDEMGLKSVKTEYQLGVETQYRTERLPLAGHGESMTVDTRVASTKLLADLGERQLGYLHYWTINSWHHFLSDHAVSIYIIPLAPDRTLIRTRWLVHADAQEGVDYDLANLTRVWIATNEQDAGLVERTHRGVCDPGYIPGPYSPISEPFTNNFVTWYIERMRAHGY